MDWRGKHLLYLLFQNYYYRCSANTDVDGNEAGPSEEQVEDLECSFCAKKLTETKVMNRHIQTLHTIVEGGVECTKDFCDLVFETRYEMYIHRDMCIFKCQVCGYIIQKNGKAAGHKKKCRASRGLRDKIEDVIIHLNQ